MTIHASHPHDSVIVLRLWSSTSGRGHLDVIEAELADIERAVQFVRQRLAGTGEPTP